MSFDEVKAMLEKALEKSKMPINEENEIGKRLDEAWNRGVTAMYNNALISVYEVLMSKEVSA